LVTELKAANEAMLVKMDAMYNATLMAVEIARSAAVPEGSSEKATGGVPWNPIPDAAALSDLGGSFLTVTFPEGRELISHPEVKIYQCKFQEIDAKGKLLDEVRLSEAVAAKTPRSFVCPTPVWGEGGSAPEKAKWTTVLTVIEANRVMPSPSPATIFEWSPNAPSITGVPESLSVQGPNNNRKDYTFDVTLVYPYGEDGFKDLTVEVKTDNADFVTNLAVTGDSKQGQRKVAYSVTSNKELIKFNLIVTVTSKLTKLTGKATVPVTWKKFQGVGKGGTTQTWGMTYNAIKRIWSKAGYGDEAAETWELCYSAKLHGYSSYQMHNRCNNKKTFVAMRRRNGRIFGGFANDHFTNSNRYKGSSNWLWRVNPSTNDVEITTSRGRHSSMNIYDNYYYSWTWGGGHDLYCDRNVNSCYSNMDHGYRPTNGGSYGSHQARTWLTGDYNWNHNSERGDYEIYHVK
jgi:hypothetical protein